MDRIEVKFASDTVDAKTGEFSGYAAVFGNIDTHSDVIQPGAFTQSLAEWGTLGKMPAMKLMHGSSANPFTGSDTPIGVWKTMREDQKGLYVEGKISGVNTDKGQYFYQLMADGALAGLSIGYKAVKASRGTIPAIKRNLEVLNLREVSLVGDPSNDRARIDQIKMADEIKTIREFESFLRDVGGYSHAAAKAIAAGGFKSADPRDEDAEALATMLRRNINTLIPKG